MKIAAQGWLEFIASLCGNKMHSVGGIYGIFIFQ